jgi:hypothetical protein
MRPPPPDPLGRVEARERGSQVPDHAVWEEGLDHQQATGLAAGTDRGTGGSGRVVSEGDERLGARGTRRHGRPEQLPAQGELALADTVGEEAVMPDALEATREHMKQLCGEANYVAREPEDAMLPSP